MLLITNWNAKLVTFLHKTQKKLTSLVALALRHVVCVFYFQIHFLQPSRFEFRDMFECYEIISCISIKTWIQFDFGRWTFCMHMQSIFYSWIDWSIFSLICAHHFRLKVESTNNDRAFRKWTTHYYRQSSQISFRCRSWVQTKYFSAATIGTGADSVVYRMDIRKSITTGN